MLKLDAFEIRGGKKLSGRVRVSGSKNAALPCLFATLLTDEPCALTNVPDLRDVRTALALLQALGKKVEHGRNRVTVTAKGRIKPVAPYDLVRRMRASAVVMGPLLARLGRARVSLPGGCSIGARPINYHLQGFEKLGAKIRVEEGYVESRSNGRLKGAVVAFPFASVGATENVLMAAVLADGRTVIRKAAREPEIDDLANMLIAMGARIRGVGTSTLTIDGMRALHGANHDVIPDRIEAGTFLIAAAITGGRIEALGARRDHLDSVIKALNAAGVDVTDTDGGLEAHVRRGLKPVSVRTAVHPGFPTDMQAQWMALMSVTPGTSAIEETIFENRFLHALELIRMGAQIEIKGRKAMIEGVPSLSGCPLMVSDLRAGAALVLAGLAARGTTRVLRVYHLDRGYDGLEKKLRKLGAHIRRVKR